MKTHPDAGPMGQTLAADLSRQLKLIGVLGRHGKTTTAHLIASVLSAGGHTVGVYSSLGYFDGLELLWPAGNATPPARVLADWLARMLENGCSHAVVAVPTRAVERAWLSTAVYDAVCVTSGTGAQRHQGHAAKGGAPPGLPELLESLAPEGVAVLNADDRATASYLAQLSWPALTVGMRRPAEITGIPVEQFASEQTFLLMAGSETIPVRTRMIGRRHRYDCLMAAAVGLAYGVDLPTVVRGLEAVECVPGRLERVECGQPFAVFVDSARTPGALKAALETLREVVAGRIICVLGVSGRGRSSHWERLRSVLSRGADVAVIAPVRFSTERSPAAVRPMPEGMPLAVAPAESSPELPSELLPKLPPEGRCRAAIRSVADRGCAIQWAFSVAQPGDAVLLAGQSPGRNLACPTCSPTDYQFAQHCLRQMPGPKPPGTVDAPS